MPKEKYIKNIKELDKKIVKRTAKLDKLLKKQSKYASAVAEGKKQTLTEHDNYKERSKKITKIAPENVKDKRNRRLNVMKLKGTVRPKSKAKRRY